MEEDGDKASYLRRNIRYIGCENHLHSQVKRRRNQRMFQHLRCNKQDI